jgi:hypothetical protein
MRRPGAAYEWGLVTREAAGVETTSLSSCLAIRPSIGQSYRRQDPWLDTGREAFLESNTPSRIMLSHGWTTTRGARRSGADCPKGREADQTG